MANDYFQFRQFTVHQALCGMKVGTDGTLLGSWAHGGRRVLDVGTGTGLLALMMAQRCPEAEVLAIDIDEGAAAQAQANVQASPFAQRIVVRQTDVRTLASDGRADGQTQEDDGLFDAIVCNPPFFIDALTSPDGQRTLARHACTLTYDELMRAAVRLLAADGELSVVVPFDYCRRMEQAAALAGLFVSRRCAVKTTPRKSPRRYLLAFRLHSVADVEERTEVLEVAPGVRSEWYDGLTKDLYL